MRVALDGECPSLHALVTVALDDDFGRLPCLPCDAAVIVPVVSVGSGMVLTVRSRTRVGFDDDGVPMFEWADALVGGAVSFEVREEFDAEAGFTKVTAVATMLNTADVLIRETAGVSASDGTLWRVTGSDPRPGLAVLKLERIDARATGVSGS